MTISTHTALRPVLDEIRHRNHATAGFTTGLAGAAAALGQACVGISGGSTVRLGELVIALQNVADDDANALGRLLVLREQGREEEGWEALEAIPAAMADLACEAAELLQGFRPQVVNQVADDLEFAIVLLSAAAHSSLLIVESNLRHWRAPALHAKFGPEVERLSNRIAALTPVDHIVWE
ncbi:MAG: cyclodeaminase/cyclohydrolase family protein [Chloroflexi bacterium]|nr:cyclodeaminase/cyclohydrolase family protein [Chloroflexota bacterium]